MIRNVRFIDDQKGYVTERTTEPVDPRSCTRRSRRGGTASESEIKTYELLKEAWDTFGPQPVRASLYYSLTERNIEFLPGKINLIVGPNGCGKTTLLKAIAGWTLCTDGFSNGLPRYCRDEKEFEEELSSYRSLLMNNNTAIVEWDGAPVYYENFRNRESYGTIGDLVGSILNDQEELVWLMNKKHLNSAAKSNFILSQVWKKLSEAKNWALDDLKEKCWKSGRSETNKFLYDYLKTLPESMNPEAPTTVLFDELDMSEDLVNAKFIFNTVLPDMVKKLGVQVIMASHNPMVFSKQILENPAYNHIFLDRKYAQDCIDILKNSF